MSQILLDITESIATITINRAEKYNALNLAMWLEIKTHCESLAENKVIKVLVITGKGDKAFSAGADIEELKKNIKNVPTQKITNQVIQKTQQLIADLPFYTIAAINGICMGGGVGIALACDYRLACSAAKFAITPAKLGLLYSVEDTQRVVNIVGLAKAKEILLLAKPLSSQDALACGLVNQCCEFEDLPNEINALKETVLANSNVSISGLKQTLAYLTGDTSYKESQIRKLFDQAFELDDFKEGAAAFVEKRKARFK